MFRLELDSNTVNIPLLEWKRESETSQQSAFFGEDFLGGFRQNYPLLGKEIVLNV